jgi:hypothetical protein
MASQGEFLVTKTVNDCTTLLSQLEAAKTTAQRISQRMVSLGIPALAGHAWPEGYTQSDFVALYTALSALPGSMVADTTRDAIFKLVSSIQ